MGASQALRAAQTSVAAGDLRAALGHLLAAWRAQPATEIADVIDQLDALARSGLHPPTGATPKARNEAWAALAREGDPVVRGVLLTSLADTRGNLDTLARINQLAGQGLDPRLAAKIGDFIERPLYNASVPRTSAFWRELFAMLPALGDARLLDRARAWPKAWRANTSLNPPEIERLERRLTTALPELERAYGERPRLSSEDLERCEAIASALRARPAASKPVSDGALLAAIYANPDDDTPRLVYADALQDRGDPRGELIAVQIARARGESTPERTAREKALLAEFKTRWLGTLASKVKKTSARFERGFLVACAPTTATIDDDPAWATVRELEGAVPGSDSCPAGALRSLVRIPGDGIRKLATLRRPLAVDALFYVQSSGYRNDFADERDAIADFARIRVLPALRQLTVGGWIAGALGPPELEWAWSAPWSTKLEQLEFPSRLQRMPVWIEALQPTRLRRVVMWGDTDADDHGSVGAGYGWCATIERDDAGDLSRMTLTAPRGAPRADVEARYGAEPVSGIAELPTSQLTSVRVVLPPSARRAEPHLRGKLEAALGRQTRLSVTNGSRFEVR